MNSAAALAAAGVALVGLWWMLRRPAQADQADQGPDLADVPGYRQFNAGNDVEQLDAPTIERFQEPDSFAAITEAIRPIDIDQAEANTAAFLAMIRAAEGTSGPNGYRTLFGGGLFSDFSDHPRIAKRFTDQAGRTQWTSAAGAYQFMAVSPIPGGGSTRLDTWDRVAARLGLPDFSPASQDAAAVELIRQAGALGDVRAGRFEQAVSKVKAIWASMPGAGYDQPERSLDALRVAYLNNGGTFA